MPIEAFSRVQELFSGVEWVDSDGDATLWFLKKLSANALQEKIGKLILNDVKELPRMESKGSIQTSPTESEDEKDKSKITDSLSSLEVEKTPKGKNILLQFVNFLDVPFSTIFKL